jgi:hypothetical protein
MNGEKDLGALLRTLEPLLHQGEYVFCGVRTCLKIVFDSFRSG